MRDHWCCGAVSACGIVGQLELLCGTTGAVEHVEALVL